MSTATDELPQDLLVRIKGSSVLALPQSASKILALSKNKENGPPEYAVPISADPGLAAQILKFANSSFFGFKYKITTIQMALSLICVRTVKNFVLWNAVFSLLPDPRMGSLPLKRFFQDALRRGVFCKVLSSYLVLPDPEETFVAGLLQDIALPILAQNWKREYKDLFERRAAEATAFSELERRTFGWDHARVGAYLVREWGFGDELAEAVRRHVSFDFNALNAKSDLLDAVVRLSVFLPASDGKVWPDAERFFSALHRVVRKPFAGEKEVPAPAVLFAETDAQYEDLLTITGIPSPPRSLVDFQNDFYRSLEEEDDGISGIRE